MPSAAGTTISPSMIALPALMCQASAATFLKRLVDAHLGVLDVHLNAIAVEFDLVKPSLTGRHPLDRGGQCRFDKAGEVRLDAYCRRPFTLKRHTKLHSLHYGDYAPAKQGVPIPLIVSACSLRCGRS